MRGSGAARVSSERGRHRRLISLFEEAVSLTGEARRLFLESCSREDPALGAELESLLEHDQHGQGRLPIRVPPALVIIVL